MKPKETFKISIAPPKGPIELKNYTDWLHGLNAIPLKEGDKVEDLLILCGGADIGVNKERDKLEFQWLQEALDKNIPILGVCRGMQLINYHLGGTVEDLDSLIVENHTADVFRYDECHHRKVSNFHWIKAIETKDLFLVNSRHHQHCTYLPNNLKPTHLALDGSVEAFEDTFNKILGVQWHPEKIETVSSTYWNQMPLNWIKSFETKKNLNV